MWEHRQQQSSTAAAYLSGSSARSALLLICVCALYGCYESESSQFKSNTLQVLHYIHRGLNLHWFSVSSDAIPVMDICMINVLGNVNV